MHYLGCRKHRNAQWRSIKLGNIVEQFSDCKFLKNDTSPFSSFFVFFNQFDFYAYTSCFFEFCASVHHSISQMKHQLDATLCRFYFCRITLHVSGASAHHQEYLKQVQRPLVHVLSLQVSHHTSLLGPKAEGPNKEMWWLTCNDNTCTSGRCSSFKYSWWWALAPETCRVTL